jgi:hypothetical protein
MIESRSVVVRLTVFATFAVPMAIAQVPPLDPVPHIAQSAGPEATFPAVPPGGTPPGNFEYTAVVSGSFLYGPNFPAPGWVPWTMGNGTGIASNGSGF